jgi:hypothetical protein
MTIVEIARTIRETLRELFGARLVAQLTMDLLNTRADAERMRSEYQGIIADLRADKAQLSARLAMHESKIGLVPLDQKKVQPHFDFSNFPPVKTSWQQLQEENDAQIAKELAEEAAQKLKAANPA